MNEKTKVSVAVTVTLVATWSVLPLGIWVDYDVHLFHSFLSTAWWGGIIGGAIIASQTKGGEGLSAGIAAWGWILYATASAAVANQGGDAAFYIWLLFVAELCAGMLSFGGPPKDNGPSRWNIRE